MLYPSPVEFPVYVEGRTLTATVKEEIDDPVNTAFRVAFSDGFEDVFLLEHEEGKVYGSDKDSIPYAKAIRYDLSQVVELDTGLFWNVFQHEMNGEIVNVWVVESHHDAKKIYLLYYKDEFRFALIKEEMQWEFVEQPQQISEADKALVIRTGFMLDSLL